MACPTQARDDAQIVLEAVKQSGGAFKYATERLKGDRQIVLEAVKLDGSMIWNAPVRFQGDPEIVREAQHNEEEGYRNSGSEKRGLFRKVHFLESLEKLEILEISESHQTVENRGEVDHFLDILENVKILEILEIPPVKRPLS